MISFVSILNQIYIYKLNLYPLMNKPNFNSPLYIYTNEP